jgi:hypothetical protein
VGIKSGDPMSLMERAGGQLVVQAYRVGSENRKRWVDCSKEEDKTCR